jgi:UDP:flavonoid glycosyltransferase YjiC (YdhE family)
MGSHGDVHPFVGVGALAARGHTILIVMKPYFEGLIRQAGSTSCHWALSRSLKRR